MPFAKSKRPRREIRSLPASRLKKLEQNLHTTEGYLEYAAWTMLEETLQTHVLRWAGQLGWELTYHTLDSRGSAGGFPDLVLIHPGKKRLLWLELKAMGVEPRADQIAWAEGLRLCGQEHYFIWPSDYHSGKVEEILR